MFPLRCVEICAYLTIPYPKLTMRRVKRHPLLRAAFMTIVTMRNPIATSRRLSLTYRWFLRYREKMRLTSRAVAVDVTIVAIVTKVLQG